MRLLLAALGLLAVVGSGSSGGGVQTLYTSPGGPIAAFAQDDSVLAWVSPGGRHQCNAVHLLSRGVKTTLPKPGTDNVTCRWNIAGGPVRLAVSASTTSDSVLWTLHQKAQISLDYVVGATAQQPLERRFAEVAHNNGGAGLWLGGIAGDAGTLVYATTEVAYVDQVECLAGGSCALKVAGGGIRRVVGRSNPPLPHTGPAVDVAAAAGRIAYIPAAAVGGNGLPQAASGQPVEVRDGQTGALVAEVTPDGVAEGVALAPHVLALAERTTTGNMAIAWYDPATTRLLGIEKVPAQTSTQIAANDSLIVFRVGRSIRAIDVMTGDIRELAKAAATPIGLSLADTRLAWAENVKGVGRIRALELG